MRQTQSSRLQELGDVGSVVHIEDEHRHSLDASSSSARSVSVKSRRPEREAILSSARLGVGSHHEADQVTERPALRLSCSVVSRRPALDAETFPQRPGIRLVLVSDARSLLELVL